MSKLEFNEETIYSLLAFADTGARIYSRIREIIERERTNPMTPEERAQLKVESDQLSASIQSWKPTV